MDSFFNHVQKSREKFAFVGLFFKSNVAGPSPNPTNNIGRLCVVFFPVSTLKRVRGEEELQDIFGKVELFYECIQKLQNIIITASLS